MSFILDALQKSENERRRNAPPGLADVRVMPAKRNRNIVIPIAAGLLGAGISLLALLSLGWFDSADTPEATGQRAGTSAPVAAAPTQSGSAEIRKLSQEAQTTQTEATPPASSSEQTAIGVVDDTVGSVAADLSGDQNLPTMNQAIVAGNLAVPPLHLDIHVYSGTTTERFVFINMAKYREGERLKEGPTVEEITKSGVVLTHQGNRFLLTRE